MMSSTKPKVITIPPRQYLLKNDWLLPVEYRTLTGNNHRRAVLRQDSVRVESILNEDSQTRKLEVPYCEKWISLAGLHATT
jgi:hypothetical protein